MVAFDVNRGFDQLNEIADKLFGDGNSVVFEIGNLTDYRLTQGRSVFLAPAAYVETNDALPDALLPRTGILGAYSTRPGTGYSLRMAASFTAPGATLLIGCDVNPTDPAQRWASGYAQDGVDVTSLSDADLGEFVGTQPGDTWPKWGEVIPGGRPRWAASTRPPLAGGPRSRLRTSG